ncbi:MAG TPA: hypothetical protein VFG62_26785 [Rhodopila sp.]|jgi:hypothetical protein|nr:hypothetical protein [Rhodopila sp.]
MTSQGGREAIIQDLEREIARCKRALGSVSDKETLDRLGSYLRDLEQALEAQVRGRPPGSTIGVNS